MGKFYIKLYRLKDILLFLLLSVIILFTSVLGAILEKRAERENPVSGEPGVKTVIIDAGHGGEDSGAVSKNGVLEKDVNLAIAFSVGEYLKERGYEVIYTRTEDRLLYTEEQNIKGLRKINDLKNRCKIAEQYPDAVFVSIHANAFAEEKYSGLQVYYSTSDEDSYGLALSIQNKVREDLQPENDRKVKAGKNIYLMENLSCAAVLIECGFLSNPEESEKLAKKEYQNLLSFSIVCGIIEYIENAGG